MNSPSAAAAILLVAALACGGRPARALQPAPVGGEPPPSIELDDIIVIARRPGADPSPVTTECVWSRLPDHEQRALTAVARHAVRTLGRQDTVPLADPAVSEGAVADALVACGAPGEPGHVPFAKVALAAYAVETETLQVLARDRIDRERMMRAWRSLTPAEQDGMIVAAVSGDDLDELPEHVVSGVFRVLRSVRPLQAFNPLAYRMGSTNHRVVYFTEAHAARAAMERRF